MIPKRYKVPSGRLAVVRVKSPMTLDNRSQGILITRENVFDEIGSYLLGQKSLRQIRDLLVTKYLLGKIWHIYVLVVVISEDWRVHNVCYSSNKWKPFELYVVPYCNQIK